jgi:alpha-galactosidase
MSEVRIQHAAHELRIESDLLTVSVNLTNGTFDIARSEGRPAVRDAAIRVRTRAGDQLTSLGDGFDYGGANGVADPRGGGVVALLHRRRQDHDPDLTVRITVYESQPFVLLRSELTNQGGPPIHVEAFEPLASGRLELPGEPFSRRFYKQGWQSWSPTLVLHCSDEDELVAPPLHAPGTTAEQSPGRFVSELVTAVVDPESQEGVIVGFVTAADEFSQVWFDREESTLSSASYADGLFVEPGQSLVSETLYIEPTGDPLQSLERYGDVLGAEMHALPQNEVASGWCSWYRFWTGVTEADIVSNLDYLTAHRQELPVQYVQLDDGYQADIGDWLTVNDKFPHGLKWLVDRIHEAGFQAGLWLAPFLAGANSQLYKDHPDWVVQHKPGTPYVAMINWGQANYALDLSRDDVHEWLHHVFSTVTGVWGFDYVKIDFVYAGAVDGIRAQEGTTRAQLYRRGLETIRKAVGDRFILGCGNPMGPSIGLVNGARIGPDVAPFWDPLPFTPMAQRNAKAEPSALNSIRNTISRYWMHGRLWQNDPDCVLVRQLDTALTEDEARTLATVIAMTGGMVLDSDDLPALDRGRTEILSMLLPVYGKSATPVDLFAGEDIPRVLELDCETHRVIALFNWNSEAAEVTAPLNAHSYVFDVWRQEFLGEHQREVRLDVPPHGCRLVGVRPVLKRPQIVGSSFHALQGACEIAGECWERGRLEITLKPVARKSGSLFVHVPAGTRIASADGVAADVDQMDGRVCRVTFELGEPAVLSLAID